MNDYLNLGMEDTPGGDAGGDFLGGGYLGLEDAPAPAAQPAGGDPFAMPATGDPYANQAGGDAGYFGDGAYLGGDPQIIEPEALGYGAPAMSSSATMPAPMAAPAPMAGELSVQAPYLEDVQPGPITVGGTRGDLSELVLDVEVKVEVYFGDAALTVEEFLEMGPGSVVELDRSIAEPVQLRVRGKLIAEGQLVTINGRYGLRIVRMLEGQA